MDITELPLEPVPHGVRLCRGAHAGECPLLKDQPRKNNDDPHGIVLEVDLDTAAHREYLRRIRAAGVGDRITLVPKVGDAFRARWAAGRDETRRFEQ